MADQIQRHFAGVFLQKINEFRCSVAEINLQDNATRLLCHQYF